jgi:hypothetical protein
MQDFGSQIHAISSVGSVFLHILAVKWTTIPIFWDKNSIFLRKTIHMRIVFATFARIFGDFQ